MLLPHIEATTLEEQNNSASRYLTAKLTVDSPFHIYFEVSLPF